ncbi:SAP domain-containing protein [Besnoitia besnoiti]|uniref:SAP domain-containing protein n=1 Tax=Besnoitia besnoiti TaxID=94643 RepID=A0A2A9MG65_BESBE|nr:SAP domain-containing protein [Besnoitia besnoiti]PFH34597.1 SAP domain-containing protein [Besnoitia besnoiti]
MPTSGESSASGASAYAAMKVTELKDLLSQRGLPTTGKKTELIDRLLQSDESTSALKPEALAGAAEASTALLPSAPLLEHAAAGELGDLSAATFEEKGDACFLHTLNAEGAGSAGGSAPQALHMAGTHAAAKTASSFSLASAAAGEKTAAGAAGTPDAVRIDTKSMTEEERRALRKAKFGVKTDDEKKLDRARRFGLSVPELEEEKKKLRAERFGTAAAPAASKPSSIGTVAVDQEEEERRRKRAERFGIVSEEEKKRKRAERFGVSSEEEKLAKRLQRFSSPAAGAPTSTTAAPVKVTGA